MKYLFTMLLLLASSPIFSEQLPYDFHTEAKMPHPQYGPTDKMYGYVDVNIGANGSGTIRVKFSNGRQLDGARFNADVKFINSSGGIVTSEHFESGIGAAGFYGSVERDHSRPVQTTSFNHVEVKFYLDNVDNVKVTVPIYRNDRFDVK